MTVPMGFATNSMNMPCLVGKVSFHIHVLIVLFYLVLYLGLRPVLKNLEILFFHKHMNFYNVFSCCSEKEDYN